MLFARRLKSRERWTRKQLEEWQHRQFLELVAFVKKHSPFYRDLYSKIEVTESLRLTDLPPITKAVMMDHYDEFVTDSRLHLSTIKKQMEKAEGGAPSRGGFHALSTAGTTGHRGAFAMTHREWIKVVATMLRWQRFTGLKFRIGKRTRFATIGAGNPIHASSRLPLSSDVGFVKFRHLVATTPLPELVAELNEFQPHVLTPYASIAALLAHEQIAGRLSIQPEIVATHSELLTAPMAERIKRAWGITPFNHYGLSEMPCLGIDCEHHRGIHPFEDLCIIEPVDTEGNPVSPGTPCDKFYLTNLIYRTQPLIRYEITDRIAVSPPDCPCGRPFSLIQTMQGRGEEMITLEGKNGDPVSIPPLALNLSVEDIPEIVEYDLYFDETRPSIEIQILTEPGICRDTVRSEALTGLESLLTRFDVKLPELIVSFVTEFPRDHDSMGKKKRVRKGPSQV